MGISTSVRTGMVVLVSLLWMSQFHTVWATIGRYGGSSFRRPVFSPPVNYGRPNFPQAGQLIPSPTHAYSILAKPPQNTFRPVQQLPQFQYQAQPPQFQPHPFPAQQQPIRYQNPGVNFQQQQNSVRFPQQQLTAASQPVPQFYVQSPVQFHQQQQRPALDNPSAGYYSYHTPTSFSVHTNSRPNAVHYHLHATPNKNVAYDSASSGSNQVLSYEGCTSSHWQPIQGGLSSSASAPAVSIATAPSSSHPTYFYGASVSPTSSYGYANTRSLAAQAQRQESNKVVVLSHDVLKTLLANSNKTSSQPKPASDSFGSASSTSHVVLPSNSVGSNVVGDQPSVKLVGYIGPTSDSTPTGYIQVPINKHIMDGLRGSQTSYDFALNSTNYSLFTLKSVNDVQSFMGSVKANDQETSASQTIPLGLVVSTETKSNAAASEPLFYSSAASSPVASVSTTSGEPVNPSIQMVGHVQITSPDVSAHFVKRQDVVEPMAVA